MMEGTNEKRKKILFLNLIFLRFPTWGYVTKLFFHLAALVSDLFLCELDHCPTVMTYWDTCRGLSHC